MGRGRPPTLKDRKTTTVSIEREQAVFILEKGIDLSKFVRDNIDAIMQSEESPIEQLERENEKLRTEKQDIEIKIRQNEAKIKEIMEAREKAGEEERLLSEFETEKRERVRESKKMMQLSTTCKREWLEYMTETCRFATFDDAKKYIRDVWLDDGVPDKKIKMFLRLN
jgi:hypothetical protein